MVSADIRQAFLKIRVRENERDALRFHWRRSEMDVVETFRFCEGIIRFSSITVPARRGP